MIEETIHLTTIIKVILADLKAELIKGKTYLTFKMAPSLRDDSNLPGFVPIARDYVYDVAGRLTGLKASDFIVCASPEKDMVHLCTLRLLNKDEIMSKWKEMSE